MDTIEQLVDEIYTLKQKRELLVRTCDDRINLLTAQLHGMLSAAKRDHATGVKAQVSPRRVESVEVQDWYKVFRFVETHHAFDILQRRITPTAVIERMNAGEKIDGLNLHQRTELVIRALPKRKE